MWTVKAIRVQMDNMTALSYLMKMGGTHSNTLIDLTKEIWELMLSKGITVTAEYLPGNLNTRADITSKVFKDSSEWGLSKKVFLKICQKRGYPDMDLFVSRLFHQLPGYMSWKADSYSQATDAF